MLELAYEAVIRLPEADGWPGRYSEAERCVLSVRDRHQLVAAVSYRRSPLYYISTKRGFSKQAGRTTYVARVEFLIQLVGQNFQFGPADLVLCNMDFDHTSWISVVFYMKLFNSSSAMKNVRLEDFLALNSWF